MYNYCICDPYFSQTSSTTYTINLMQPYMIGDQWTVTLSGPGFNQSHTVSSSVGSVNITTPAAATNMIVTGTGSPGSKTTTTLFNQSPGTNTCFYILNPGGSMFQSPYQVVPCDQVKAQFGRG